MTLAGLGRISRREMWRAIVAAVAALRLIALAGLRREEACALRWREIDETASCLPLETTKTGRSIRPIGRSALHLLSTLPRGPSEWVFPNRDGSGRADLKKVIAALLQTAPGRSNDRMDRPAIGGTGHYY